jgi:phosphonate transport system substrate-binding protein
LARVEPDLIARTKVIGQSENLGVPPFVSRQGEAQTGVVAALRHALLGMDQTVEGRAALGLLQLDKVIAGEVSLFDGNRARMRDMAG